MKRLTESQMTLMESAAKKLKLMFERKPAPPSFGRSEDLLLWNKIQFTLWKELTQKFELDRNDATLFSKFGLAFYEWFIEFGDIPDVEEIAEIFLAA